MVYVFNSYVSLLQLTLIPSLFPRFSGTRAWEWGYLVPRTIWYLAQFSCLNFRLWTWTLPSSLTTLWKRGWSHVGSSHRYTSLAWSTHAHSSQWRLSQPVPCSQQCRWRWRCWGEHARPRGGEGGVSQAWDPSHGDDAAEVSTRDAKVGKHRWGSFSPLPRPLMQSMRNKKF